MNITKHNSPRRALFVTATLETWRQFLPRTVSEAAAYLFWVSVGLALIGLLYWGGAVAQDLMGVER